ncbi:MAG TPA: hypothetical protein VG816_06260 [Solirubrobacterales bacterium]|nr:hypothetical protein [Solirubrobacterales bacterium]
MAVPAQAARVRHLISREALPYPGYTIFWSAVNQTTHHLYVMGTAPNGEPRHIYNFTPAGVLDPVEPELTGIQPFKPFGIAVDNSGGAHDGYIYTTEVFGFVQQFTPSGTPTAVKITAASIPPSGTAQSGGLPPVVNTGEFHPRGVAVDDSGNIYVNEPSARAIDEFTSAGAFVAQRPENTGVGAFNSIALDASGNVYEARREEGKQGIFEFTPSGNCVPVSCAALIPGSFDAVAVDRASGTIFTASTDGGPGSFQGSFSEYDSSGNLLGRTEPASLYTPSGIAIDESSGNLILADEANSVAADSTLQVYGPAEVVPDVETEPADQVTDHSASFHGKIGAAEVPGATCAFQYVSEAGFKEHGFKGAAQAPCEPAGPFSGSAMNAVHAEASNLSGGTTYHYRLLGENGNGSNGGEDLPFTTPGPSVSETEASEVTETSAILSGLVDSRSSQTTYAFQYVTSAQFEANGYAEATSVPVPAGAVPTQTIGTGDLQEKTTLVRHAEASEGTFLAGQSIEGQGIPAETKIVSVEAGKGGSKLTLSKNATETLASVALTASGNQPVSQPIGGLVPDTIYHFRIAATSTGGATAGSTFGEDRAFSTYPPPSVGLPDGRVYEQASPVKKNGANIQGEQQAVQASTDGDRITFISLAGIPGGEGESTLASYMASRAPDGSGWSTRGMLPPASYGPLAGVLGWDEELASVYSFASTLGGSTSLLVRSSADGSISEVGQVAQEGTSAQSYIAGASTDGRVALLESRAGGLLPGDLAGKQNVYAYDRETSDLVLAGVMNDGSPAPEGAMGGPYNWYRGTADPSVGRGGEYYTQPNHAISTDGRRIFFTSGTGQLYVRENPLAPQSQMNGEKCTEAATKACTVRVSAPEEGVTDPGTNAVFSWASTDGSLVYFLDKGRLTADSTAGPGYDLYRYDVESGELTDLTVDTADGQGAQVRAVLGVGADGEDAYYVASGALAPGAEKAPPSETNVYALHGEEAVFIARLSTDEAGEANWIPTSVTDGGPPVARASRVSANGLALLFASRAQLTSYRNHGAPELYLYRKGRELRCVSCNSTGAAPQGGAGVQSIPKPGVSAKHSLAIMTHNLSADGRRVVFDSSDRLVSADENTVNDVYEWEEKGKGSCQSEAQDGGCIFLISSGTSSRPSYFGDADVEGNNVFFFTTAQLVAQDKDELVDLYDARIGGGIAAQNAVSPPPCEGEACLGQSNSSSSAQTPGTSTFAGPGNPARPPACKKGRTRVHGRCVKPRHAKKKHSKKHQKQKRRAERAKGGSGR